MLSIIVLEVGVLEIISKEKNRKSVIGWNPTFLSLLGTHTLLSRYSGVLGLLQGQMVGK